MTDRRPLLVVDAPSLLYRAFFALPTTITDGSGRPVNALLGAFNMIMRVVADHGPRAVVLASGPDAADYRAAAYPGYHTDRPPVPDELAPQFEDAPDFFGALGWVWAYTHDLEADDLLHSFALAEEQAGGTALLLTGDRDLFQCATDRTTVLYVKTGTKGVEEVGPQEVRRRYGVPPELVPDFIALRGDPSDKIPGARGVGEKGAANLLSQYGSLERMLEEGRFAAEADALRLYRKLATLDRAAPLPDLPDLEPAWGELAARASEIGLGRLARLLEEAAAAQ